MLKNISWSSYWLFIVIMLVIYYAVICAMYYLHEIKQILSGKSNLLLKIKSTKKFVDVTNTKNNTDNILNENYYAQDNVAGNCDNEQALFPLINQFINEIRSTLEHAAKNNLIKQEIIYSFQHLSKKYPSVKDSPFKSFISNYILIECSNYCSIHLSEDELNMLWEK